MANKVYTNRETSINFLSTGGNVTFPADSLSAGSGAVSARYDFGSGSHASRFEWRAFIAVTGTPVVGSGVGVYAATSDGTYMDGSALGSGSATFANRANLTNLKYMGTVMIDIASNNGKYVNSGPVEILSRYTSFVFMNDTGVPLAGSGNGLILTPVPDEIQ